VVAVALLLFIGVGIAVYRAVTAQPRAPVDYASRLEALLLASRPVDAEPGAEDAYALLLRAIDRLAEAEAEADASLGQSGGRVDYTLLQGPTATTVPGFDTESQEKMRSRARAALAAMETRGVPELLDRLTVAPWGNGHARQDGPIVMWLLPHLGRSRDLARATAGAMQEAANRGDWAEVSRRYEHLLAVGRVHMQQSFIIERLVGIAIISLGNSRLSEIMADGGGDAPMFRRCLEALERQRAWCPSPSLSLESERISQLDTLQAVYTDNGRGNGRLVVTAYASLFGGWGLGPPAGAAGGSGMLDKLREYQIANLAGFTYASKASATRKLNALIDMAQAAHEAGPADRERHIAEFETAVIELPRRYAVLRQLMPAMGRYASANAQDRLSCDGIRLQLALELHRAAHGRYPESLEALAPEFLAEVPPDAFNGQRFGYRLLSPEEDRRGYLLYSFGADREDNGGVTSPRNSFAAFQLPFGAGLDFVFNVPPRTQEEVDAEASGDGGPP
jgi:hypothetical protein